ncbi:division plane positioning ATPase MipZ [Ponticaulis profundi]|uniref:Division plane positioning ATPase MipZ n=1 Tax=Ponticaulis profundi TaxID=2665222 RepID=A0ABW1SBT7_9PROT
MKVITIGSFKGGTGKTTLAAVLSTALTLRGFKTLVIELETSTKPLARFEACRDFADLSHPNVQDLLCSGGQPDVKDWQIMFRQEMTEAERRGYDVMIVDTASVWKPEVIAAHLMADLVITTVTESPIDLYQIMPTSGPSMQASRPYAQLIDLVRRHAAQNNRHDFGWFMCINRRSHLRTKVGDSVREQLESFTENTNVDLIYGLVDRVGYRNMMATGITPLDDVEGEPVQKSLLAARTESNRLVGKVMLSLGLRAKTLESAAA